MLIAEAVVATARPGRYLAQLCGHLTLVARAQPGLRAQVTSSEDNGVISLGWGRCTLHAGPGALILRVEAHDEEGLHELEKRIAGRLEQIGRRDRLTVTWTAPTWTAPRRCGRDDAVGRDREGGTR